MKIKFCDNISIKDAKNPAVLIVSKDQLDSLEIKFVDFAKDNFDFAAKFGQICILTFKEKVVILAGSGDNKDLTDLKIQKLGAKILEYLNSNKIKTAEVFFGSEIGADFRVKPRTTKEICELGFGSLLRSYRFNKYFEDKASDKKFNVEVLNIKCADVAKSEKSFAEFQTLANNVFFARDLVSEPSNVLNPESYAEICETLKKDGVEVEVLGEKEMKKLGMNALLGVGQGSAFESKLVVMKWNGSSKKSSKPIAFVGKGVTFDTGGISIKPSNNMEDMKTDMGGSAVVVSLMKNLAQRKAKVNAVGVVGLVENMPSGTAQRPGDVVKSMSGQTIEVINTDAEGRLVLADALHYTNTNFEPEAIIDLATLTGAIIVSLADVHAGLFCNDDDLSSQLIDSGNETGDRVWRLPIGKEYDDMINSDIADMKNVGSGRGAGSITAAQFLKRFIGDTKWAHLDIAGVAWKGKGDPLAVKGATGYGVRLLDRLVKNYYED